MTTLLVFEFGQINLKLTWLNNVYGSLKATDNKAELHKNRINSSFISN